MVSVDKSVLDIIARYNDRFSRPLRQSTKRAKRDIERNVLDPFKKVRTSALALRTAIAGTFAAVGGALIAREMIEFGKSISQAAAEAEELENRFNVAFGEGAEAAREFAAELGGRVKRGIQDITFAMAEFQRILVSLDLPVEEARAFSQELTELAIDLSSFADVSVERAITALRSGLTGEVEPLKRLGIAINETIIRQKALELGFKGLGQVIDPTIRSVTTMALVLEQASIAQGDAERTADSFTNTMRALESLLKDVKARLGKDLNDEILNFIQNAGGIEVIVGQIELGMKGVTQTLILAVRILTSFTEQYFGIAGRIAELTGNDQQAKAFEELLQSPLIQIPKIQKAIGELKKELFDIESGAPISGRRFTRDTPDRESIADQIRRDIAVERAKLQGYELSDPDLFGALFTQFDDAGNALPKVEAVFQKFGEFSEDAAEKTDEFRKAIDKRVEAHNASPEVIRRDIQEMTGFASITDVVEKATRKHTLSASEQIKALEEWRATAQQAIEDYAKLEGNQEEAEAATRALNRAFDDQRAKIATSKAGVEELANTIASRYSTAVGLMLDSLQHIGRATVEFKRSQERVSETGQVVGSALVSAFNAITPAINTSTNALEKFVATLGQALAQAALQKGIGQITDAIFPSVTANATGGIVHGTQKIPGYAAGGIVRKPTIAAIAETGQPEAVVPLSGGRNIPVEIRGGGESVNVNFTVQAIDQAGVASFFHGNRQYLTEAFLDAFYESSTLRHTVQGRA